ncbi:hypothetical protein AX16_003089 [Volvariella volvacea WC 439]|nr:hypothetical protein AX16_003089 [Volvariella volvacea WC 439]
MSYSGACLCGATTITIILCHCLDCQRTSGSAFSTNVLVPDENVKIEGAFGTYQSKALSGNTVTRTYCTKCGSAIAHASPGLGGNHAVQTGNIPHFRTVPIGTELFVKDRWTGIPAITGAAQFDTAP